MLQHKTTIELRAEPTHEGTNEVIAAIIDKLGELIHGCAIITGCKMAIDWVAGGTYQSHLEEADIHDTCIDPDTEKKKENLRMLITEWIVHHIENVGVPFVPECDINIVLNGIIDELRYVSVSQEYPRWINSINEVLWTVDEFNWFCNGLNLQYRLLPAKFQGQSGYEFVDITKNDEEAPQ